MVMNYVAFKQCDRMQLRKGQRVTVSHIGSNGKRSGKRLPDLAGTIGGVVIEQNLLQVLLDGETHLHPFNISDGQNVGISREYYPSIISIDTEI